MNCLLRTRALSVALLLLFPACCCLAAEPEFTRQRDVIYGRKHGVVLTMDVITPQQTNGAAIVFAVSGGWFSSHQAIRPPAYAQLLARGYTVFAVVHGSQPKYTIPEILQDMHRAVRFIRHNAKEYNIDPDRIGITGMSAGGHLSLMQGAAGQPGDEKAQDPIDRASSRVQAVACFFPPTDFLNYGAEGVDAIGRGPLAAFKAPFEFREYDGQSRTLAPITDEEKIVEIGKNISPVTHVTADDPPMLIIHGDADKLVPIQQAELMIARLDKAGVASKLVVKQGAAHGWANILDDLATVADWFDEHLAADEVKKTDP